MPAPPWLLGFDGTIKPPENPPPLVVSGQPAPGEAKEVLSLEDREKLLKETRVVSAYLRSAAKSGSSAWTNTVDEKPCYVIIGLGFSAVVDHSTLLHDRVARKRAEGLRIVHVGFPDLWPAYRDHEMNQEVELLTHPGFLNHPASPGAPLWEDHVHGRSCVKDHIERNVPFLRSGEFGRVTAAELAEILNVSRTVGKGDVRQAQVIRITKGAQPGYYVVHTSIGATIKAACIDICTGPGVSRVLARDAKGERALLMDRDLWEQYENPGPVDELSFPRIVAGSEYTRGMIGTKPEWEICIQGSGPAAAQAAEEAFRMEASNILWLGSESLSRAIFQNTRVDFLVNVDGKPPANPRLGPPRGTLLPRLSGLTIAEAYRVGSVQILTKELIEMLRSKETKLRGELIEQSEQGRLLIGFNKVKDGNHRFANCEGNIGGELQYGVFDQLVLSQALQDMQTEVGTAFYLVKDLGIALQALHAPEVPYPTGLQSADGRIRILGGAAIGNKGFRSIVGDRDANALSVFQDSLPAQARVNFQGVTLNSLTVAQSNWYFGENDNVNTATWRELRVHTDNEIADALYYVRSMRVRPFTRLEDLRGAVGLYLAEVKKGFEWAVQFQEPAPTGKWIADANNSLADYVNVAKERIPEHRLGRLEKLKFNYTKPDAYRA